MKFFGENQYLHHLKTFHPHLVPPNYETFSSVVAAPPQAAPEAAPQPSSVVYPPRQVQVPQPTPQPISEITDQLSQMKCVISDMKVGISDLKISSNQMRLELSDHRGQLNEVMANNGYWKKHKKNQGLCMQATILSIVVLIIGVVLGSYLTVGLSKN
jgi:TolA-binding protein